METKKKKRFSVFIKGAGEMASAIAWRLYLANVRHLLMMEVDQPLAVRRGVSFSEAIHDGTKMVEGVCAEKISHIEQLEGVWKKGAIAVMADPRWKSVQKGKPDVLIDAILAKRNLGTRMDEAPLVIGAGPGFTAGRDAHLVIETNRGHHLGRVITSGEAEPNTGIPGNIGGVTLERVLRAPADGVFRAEKAIGDQVGRGETVARIGANKIVAKVDGVIRGLLRHGTPVKTGWKLGDIDPRGDARHCGTISDKARAISGSVLEGILRYYPPFG